MSVLPRVHRAVRFGRVLQTGGGPCPRRVCLVTGPWLFSGSPQHPVLNAILARRVQAAFQDVGLSLLRVIPAITVGAAELRLG